jgi:LemA protein
MTPIYVLIAVIAVVLLWVMYAYNRLISLRLRVKEALSDIDVQSKRRFDLIPNLVETVKGYMTHERDVLENVTKARAMVATGGNQIEKQGAENVLTNTLKTLFAVAENYPDLKANANFLDLQRELVDTENKMQAARRFFNDTVGDLNVAIQTFPTNLLASMFGFNEEKFFEVTSDAEREVVKVKF